MLTARWTYNGFLWRETLGAMGFGLAGAAGHLDTWLWPVAGLLAGIILTFGVAGVISRFVEEPGSTIWRKMFSTPLESALVRKRKDAASRLSLGMRGAN